MVEAAGVEPFAMLKTGKLLILQIIACKMHTKSHLDF